MAGTGSYCGLCHTVVTEEITTTWLAPSYDSQGECTWVGRGALSLGQRLERTNLSVLISPCFHSDLFNFKHRATVEFKDSEGRGAPGYLAKGKADAHVFFFLIMPEHSRLTL